MLPVLALESSPRLPRSSTAGGYFTSGTIAAPALSNASPSPIAMGLPSHSSDTSHLPYYYHHAYARTQPKLRTLSERESEGGSPSSLLFTSATPNSASAANRHGRSRVKATMSFSPSPSSASTAFPSSHSKGNVNALRRSVRLSRLDDFLDFSDDSSPPSENSTGSNSTGSGNSAWADRAVGDSNHSASSAVGLGMVRPAGGASVEVESGVERERERTLNGSGIATAKGAQRNSTIGPSLSISDLSSSIDMDVPEDEEEEEGEGEGDGDGDISPQELQWRADFETKHDFFEERALPNQVGVNVRNHKLNVEEAPVWEGYGRASLNWHSILLFSRITENDDEGTISFRDPILKANKAIPKRVLDIGCGVDCAWILHMLRQKGWERSSFVGLDLAPVLLVPELILPYSDATRVSFVQANFLKGLPFMDSKFDWVRIGFCSRGIPEHMWEELLSECSRVAVPGATIEVNDMNFNAAPETLQPSAAPVPSPSLVESPALHQSESRSIVLAAYQNLSSTRFINPLPLSLIPATLAMTCKKTQKAVMYDLILPANQEAEREHDKGRVLGHLFADYVMGCSVICAKELAEQQTAEMDGKELDVPEALPASPEPQLSSPPRRRGADGGAFSPPTRSILARTIARPVAAAAIASVFQSSGETSPGVEEEQEAELSRLAWLKDKPKRRIEAEVYGAYREWVDELIDRAGIAKLVSERWKWHCRMDETVEKYLDDLVPALSARLDDFQKEHDQYGWEREIDPDAELRMSQIAMAKREATSEMKAVRKRLGREPFAGTALGKMGLKHMGRLECGEWVAVV